MLTVEITGRLSHSELTAVQRSAKRIIQRHGNVKVLVIAEAFLGWDKKGDWGDLSAQAEIDPHIEKMAIVGEKKWEDLALIFAAKGLRGFPIEYFSPANLSQARAWLVAGDDESQ
jgi:hypothetical protein